MESASVVTSEPATTMVLPTFDTNKEIMEYTILVPTVQNKPANQMAPSEFKVNNFQLDFSRLRNTDKINVSKKNNELVYTSLLKQDREKKRLQTQIEKLQVDLANEKAKRKAVDNKSNELEKIIKNMPLH